MEWPSSSQSLPFKYPCVSIQSSKTVEQRPQPPPNTTTPEYTSTPSDHGPPYQPVNDAFMNPLANSAAPMITYDVDKNEKTGVHEMLSFLLGQCATKYNDTVMQQHSRLSEVLNAVIPICNNDETIADVKDYCEELAVEQDRYAPFVKLCNNILQKTIGEVFLGLREPSLEISFHHNGMDASQNPGEGGTELCAAKEKGSDEERDIPSEDFAMTSALEEYRQCFSWGNFLAVAELKLRLKICNNPPEQYGATLTEKIRHIDDIRGTLRAVSADEAPQSPANKQITPKPIPILRPRERREKMQKEAQGLQHPKRKTAEISVKRNRVITKSETPPQKKSKLQAFLQAEQAPVENNATNDIIPPIVQNAMYGTEMLCRGPYASHAITLLILDDVAWMWWFDRQGAIQSAGINFVQDLPYFAALLVAFQRFDLRAWGIIDELLPHETYGYAQFNVRFPKEDLVVASKPEADLCEGYSLTGRCTRVYSATGATGDDCQSLSTNIQIGEDLPKKDLALKICWPEESRPNEAEILGKAHALGKSEDAIRDHIPELLASRDLVYSTSTIREWLGLERAEGTHSQSRVLRILLFEQLQQLDPDILPMGDFMRGWKQCFICHFYLWDGGIEHGDISLGNLMWNPEKKTGVMGDFDLATLRGSPDMRGGERTGTVPFMAIDLLTKEYFNGEIIRLYRHDVESFVWVLIWVCTRHDQECRTTLWNTSNYALCNIYKWSFISRLYETLSIKDGDLWRLTVALICWVYRGYKARRRGLQQNALPHKEVFDEVKAIIDNNWAWN